MRILLSNDDGYFSPGLAALAKGLAPLGEITVVAPERDRSGASNSLTLDRPLTLRRAPNDFWYVSGTPTDCVHMAVTGMLDFEPDFVVSGINLGSNMGDDTLYSGTVAAATEGYLLGIPSVAVSLVGNELTHFDTAARVARTIVERLAKAPFGAPILLNVNVPDVPYEALKGMEVTRLGRRHKAQPVVRGKNPRGETVYWVGPAGEAREAGPGTDFHALEHGAVSVTPLQVDLTHLAQVQQVKDWIGEAMTGVAGIGMTSDRTRQRMVELLRREGITDERVLAAMQEIPRHAFVEEGIASRAYEDTPLPIGHGQTISSPYIVAQMTQLLLEHGPMGKVLEVGTGCGYQTAVLAKLVKEVYTLERIAPLMDKARRHLRDLRFYNVRFKHADGHAGYADGAPYEGILSAASASHVPPALKEQLAVGGRLVLPVGTGDQWLYVIDRTEKGFTEQKREAVRFVPLLPGLAP